MASTNKNMSQKTIIDKLNKADRNRNKARYSRNQKARHQFYHLRRSVSAILLFWIVSVASGEDNAEDNIANLVSDITWNTITNNLSEPLSVNEDGKIDINQSPFIVFVRGMDDEKKRELASILKPYLQPLVTQTISSPSSSGVSMEEFNRLKAKVDALTSRYQDGDGVVLGELKSERNEREITDLRKKVQKLDVRLTTINHAWENDVKDALVNGLALEQVRISLENNLRGPKGDKGDPGAGISQADRKAIRDYLNDLVDHVQGITKEFNWPTSH